MLHYPAVRFQHRSHLARIIAKRRGWIIENPFWHWPEKTTPNVNYRGLQTVLLPNAQESFRYLPIAGY